MMPEGLLPSFTSSEMPEKKGCTPIVGVTTVLVPEVVAVVLMPMALVGIGFADTWFRFRERLVKR